MWHYVWGKTTFKSTDYYHFFFREIQSHEVFRCLWKSKCIMKLKVFAWLLLNDRLNTRNMLKRRHYNIGDDHNCLLCGLNIEETVEHMIFTCHFSSICWDTLNIHWTTNGDRLNWIKEAKTVWNNPMFMEIFLYASWSLWKERNNKHFLRIDPTVGSWARRFKEDLSLLIHRAKEKHKQFLSTFIQTFVVP